MNIWVNMPIQYTTANCFYDTLVGVGVSILKALRTVLTHSASRYTCSSTLTFW